jgi:hypothetical protein
MGLQRFVGELDALPPAIREAVIASLRGRISEHGVEYVLHSSIAHLVA